LVWLCDPDRPVFDAQSLKVLKQFRTFLFFSDKTRIGISNLPQHQLWSVWLRGLGFHSDLPGTFDAIIFSSNSNLMPHKTPNELGFYIDHP
jgi:hypothetical protein